MDKSKKKVPQEESKQTVEYDDILVENKISQVSIQLNKTTIHIIKLVCDWVILIT